MAKGKPVIDRERCKGCKLCVGSCPKKILRLSDKTNSQGIYYSECFDEDECIACSFCATMCPEVAIEIIKYD